MDAMTSTPSPLCGDGMLCPSAVEMTIQNP